MGQSPQSQPRALKLRLLAGLCDVFSSYLHMRLQLGAS
jgi:hypothetical protein